MTVPVDAPLPERSDARPGAIPDDVFSAREPVVLRGYAGRWPAVKAGREGGSAARDYLMGFHEGATVAASFGPPEAKGRLFYNESWTAPNAELVRIGLAELLDRILEEGGKPEPPLVYLASTTIDVLLPGFHARNDPGLGGRDALGSIWIGGPSRIPAHQDLPDNLAVVLAGRRRFTLFPPEQLPNLYIGPLDVTPAGQPVTLADLNEPDFEAFPKLKDALAAARFAELEPGDAVFIPSMWWHHVQATAPFNALANYWWRETPVWMGPPQNALHHAILAIRNLPPEDRAVWKQVFDHYVFSDPGEAAAHIPSQARGVLGPMTDANARRIRAYLLNRLNR